MATCKFRMNVQARRNFTMQTRTRSRKFAERQSDLLKTGLLCSPYLLCLRSQAYDAVREREGKSREPWLPVFISTGLLLPTCVRSRPRSNSSSAVAGNRRRRRIFLPLSGKYFPSLPPSLSRRRSLSGSSISFASPSRRSLSIPSPSRPSPLSLSNSLQNPTAYLIRRFLQNPTASSAPKPPTSNCATPPSTAAASTGYAGTPPPTTTSSTRPSTSHPAPLSLSLSISLSLFPSLPVSPLPADLIHFSHLVIDYAQTDNGPLILF
ncbi:hypothetical protein ACLOJK_014508 [Asimina triloba]